MDRFINEIRSDFIRVAEIAGIHASAGDILVETHKAPHSPPNRLPKGKMAVYVFSLGERCLKVGKVGPRSQARYTSQHYKPNSSKSNLAKSILDHKDELGVVHIDELTVGDWIKNNTDRINFILEARLGVPVLTLLEAFLQCRLKPLFEGFPSQR